MSTAYRLNNVCGSVYKTGNLIFTPDGKRVVAPVGNRVTVTDLVGHVSYTLDAEARSDIARVAISPDGHLVLAIDKDGHAVVIHHDRRTIVHRFTFRGPVRDAQFSPDGRYIAVTNKNKLEVWRAPSLDKEFSPFALHRTYTGHFDDIVSIDWSPDGQYLLTASKDATARVYTLNPVPGFIPVTLSGHRDRLVSAHFAAADAIYTVSKDGGVAVWVWAPEGSEARQLLVSKAKRARGYTPEDDAEESQPEEGEGEGEQEGAGEDREEGEDGSGLAVKLDAAQRIRSKPSVAMLASRIAHDIPAPVLDPVTGRVSLVRGQWMMQAKQYIRQDQSSVQCAALHRATGLLVVGWDSGAFGLYSMPEGRLMHALSVSAHEVHSVAISADGAWLALGSRSLGQLLVWDWQGESYVLRQQGHAYAVDACAYSPNGQLVVTGGGDGKVKVWNATSGFCFVTFTEHKAGITGVTFIGGKGGHGLAVLSSSLDGTVRAFDLVRYRNFRTLTAPAKGGDTGASVQFSCVAADESGEIVVAGGLDPFNIYVWALATGKCTDVLAGHASPISGLSFSASTSLLASSSWDKTVRVWDVYRSGTATEVFTHGTDVLDVSFRPDGEELAACCLDGTLAVWNVKRGVQTGSIDGRLDVQPGRKEGDARAAANQQGVQHFSSVAYSPDGELLLAGGRSAYVCLYAVKPKLLLRRFAVTHNRSLSGILQKLNSKGLGEGGVPLALLDLDPTDADAEDARRVPDDSLPGVRKGDAASRRHAAAEARVGRVAWAPTGSAFGAATPEGLLLFARDEGLVFDPFELGEDVTLEALEAALARGSHARALLLACHLGEPALLERCLEGTPVDLIRLVVRALPLAFLDKVLASVAARVQPGGAKSSPHLEFYLTWLLALLGSHGAAYTARPTLFASSLRAAHKALVARRDSLVSLCEGNRHLLAFLMEAPPLVQA